MTKDLYIYSSQTLCGARISFVSRTKLQKKERLL
jgi:hypothetical protein